MLVEEDFALIQRDTEIPGLSLLLNPDDLRKQMLAKTGLQDPGKLEIEYLRYKPGQSCIARYRFQAGDKEQYAYARAFSIYARTKLDKAREQVAYAGPLGPGRITLEKEQIQFSVFPNDLKLRSVGRLEQIQERQNLLTRLFNPRPGWETATFSHLNYKPERRYVARCTNESGESALIKFYSRTEFSRVRKIQKLLRPGPQTRLSELIGGSKVHHALAFSWLPGNMLRQYLGQQQLLEVVAAGTAIAQFHSQPQLHLKPRAHEHLSLRLLALAQDLGKVLPELASLANQLAANMGQWWVAQDDPAIPLHGDFYDKQLIVDGQSVSLIDMDDAHLGHPLIDLACFIAHLERSAINHHINPKDIGKISEALIAGYKEITPGLNIQPLGRLIAISLFQLAHHPFRDRVPDWPEQTQILVDRCTTLFGDLS
ncbi:MAG: aminoglycoside phosphotransferase (APT) family kinase protein [Lysobacterales bacterium]|jgi:aminoglycoside phosphotransferase (APT) family kinase protein